MFIGQAYNAYFVFARMHCFKYQFYSCVCVGMSWLVCLFVYACLPPCRRFSVCQLSPAHDSQRKLHGSNLQIQLGDRLTYFPAVMEGCGLTAGRSHGWGGIQNLHLLGNGKRNERSEEQVLKREESEIERLVSTV